MKIQHPYSGRVVEIIHETHECATLIGNVSASRALDLTDQKRLEQATSHLARARDNFGPLNKRANAILKIALEQTGLAHKIGRWTLTLEEDMRYFPKDGSGNLRFSLDIPHGTQWKGNIRECPLMKVMPLEFPVSWLDLPARKLRKVMAERQ